MASFNDITSRIKQAIDRFNKKIPASQRAMLDGIEEQLTRLDLKGSRIKPTIANLKIVGAIKNKLLGLVLNDEYMGEVKQFAQAFRDVSILQREYWQGIESTFKPRSILKEIRTQAISDTVSKLTDSGIGTNISDNISDILRTNITTGGAYKDLLGQLRESLTDTQKSDGLLTRYAKQITTDSINQYSANYTQIVSSDLGYEWYAYQGTDIKTTRPWCDSMTDRRYFHVSELPSLLRADNMYYEKNGQRLKVPIYAKTGLPNGMIDGTNPENIFVRRGGYNCGHQIRPVSASLVKLQNNELYNQVIASPQYNAWIKQQPIPRQEIPIEPVPETPISPTSEIIPEEINTEVFKPTGSIKEYDLAVLTSNNSESFGFLMNRSEQMDRMVNAFPEFKKEEIAAVSEYGNTYYRRINSYLRDKDAPRQEYEENFAIVMNNALNKLPNYSETVYRGGTFSKALLSKYKTGVTVTEDAFVSTSKYAGTALEGDTFFIIRSKTGKEVEKIMEFEIEGPTEGEVLFKPGTRFKVDEVKVEKVEDEFLKAKGIKKRTIIRMTEL